MTFDREAFLERFWRMDAALVAKGFHATSPWWRAEIERFVRSGRPRWVVRAGRRSGKSSTLTRLAVAWAWFGDWDVPAGDVAVVPFVSVSKDEASARLRTIAAVLDALDLEYEQAGDEVEFAGPKPVLFKPIACTTKAVVGFTSICVIADEVARWESRDTAANPAREVIGSLAPTTASQPNAFMVLSSAPWGVDDLHHERFEAGDNEQQLVSFAATWTANPSISEARTHELEPDPRTWSREYGAVPGGTISDAFDAEDVAQCFRKPEWGPARPFMTIDASSLRGDAFTWALGGVSLADEVVVSEVGGWEGEQLRRVSMADVVSDIADRAKAANVSTIFADQREEASLTSMFCTEGVGFKSYAWSEPSKDDAMQLLRRLMRERRLYLPEHERLKRELLTMKARLLPSGRISYSTNGLDFASTLITLAHAVNAGDFYTTRPRVPQITSPSGTRDALLRAAGAVRDRFGVWRYGAGYPPVRIDGVGDEGPGRRPRRGAWR